MAGSRTWRRYVSDMDRVYRYEVDKSAADGRLFPGNNRLLLPSGQNAPIFPIGLQPRYFLAYNRALPTSKRRFVLGEAQWLTQSMLDGSGYITTDDGNPPNRTITWILTRYVGETYRNMPRPYDVADTGLRDGDTSQ